MASSKSKVSIDVLREVIRAKGLRATPSRLAVLGLLETVDAPMSHGEVADRLRGGEWDRATVYRNLTDLTEVGLARRTDVGDHTWRFEKAGGADDAGEHPHFVCTGCGVVACLPNLQLSLRAGRAPRAVRQKQVEVQLRGLCDVCQ